MYSFTNIRDTQVYVSDEYGVVRRFGANETITGLSAYFFNYTDTVSEDPVLSSSDTPPSTIPTSKVGRLYDNSQSNLSGRTFQAAVDELASRPYTPYLVESGGSIQDAIDDAVSAGHDFSDPAVIFPKSGQYTEDLTLYPYIHVAGPDDSRYPVTVTGTHTYTTNSNSTAENQITLSNMTFNANTGQTSPILSLGGTVGNKIFIKNLSVQGQNSTGTSIITASVQPGSEVNLVDSHVYGPTGGPVAQPSNALVHVVGASLSVVRTNIDSYGARAVYYDPTTTWGGWMEDAVLDLRSPATFTGGFLKLNGSAHSPDWARLFDIYRGRIGSAPYSNNCTQPFIELTGQLQVSLQAPVVRSESSPSVLFTDAGETVDLYYTWVAYGESHSGAYMPTAVGPNFFTHPMKIDDSKQLLYDNTTSGLTATDVQGAIDELKALIDSYH